MIGLTESGSQYEERGYTPLKQAVGQVAFRRFGMPLAAEVKDRMAGTSRACRAIVAARLAEPDSEWRTFRALQALQFESGDRLDDDAAIARAVGADIAGAIDREDVVAAYERDRAEARTAAGSPADAQGKTASSDGPVRYTAPSLVFRAGDRELIAGGFQSLVAYDVLLANLDPALERRAAPDDVAEVLTAFPAGLYTAEVAEIYASGAASEVDLEAAEERLLAASEGGRLIRRNALWRSV
jgi:protein-disulfide isomerase-like protein with CxxC motif